MSNWSRVCIKTIKTKFGFVSKIFIIFIVVFYLLLFNGCAFLFFNPVPYNILETNHFTFFYYPGTKVEKDLELIAKYSEIAIIWYENWSKIKVNFKIDVFMFDEGTNSNIFLKAVDKSMLDSNSLKGVITYYYKEKDYFQASATILHEVTHVLQEFVFKLNSIGIQEGYSSFVTLNYYFYIIGSSYNYNELFSYIKVFVNNAIENNQFESPDYIFGLSIPDFNNVGFVNGILARNPKYRYEISQSFINYVIIIYGVEKLHRWLYNCDRFNYKKRFKEEFKVDFETFLNLWQENVVY